MKLNLRPKNMFLYNLERNERKPIFEGSLTGGYAQAVAERSIRYFIGDLKLRHLGHTTSQSYHSAELPALLKAMEPFVSPWGYSALQKAFGAPTVPIEEKEVRLHAALELAEKPEIRSAILMLGNTLSAIQMGHDEKDLKRTQCQLISAKKSFEEIRGNLASEYLKGLELKIADYFDSCEIRAFLDSNFSSPHIPNPFGKFKKGRVRRDPIYLFEFGGSTLLLATIGALIGATGISAPVEVLTAIYGPLWGVTGVEAVYAARYDKLLENYEKTVLLGNMHRHMVGAMMALEESSCLGHLHTLPGASVPRHYTGSDTISIDGARCPIAALQGIETTPNDIYLRAGMPLTLTGQNGGGKTYTPGVLIRNIAFANRGGPVFGSNAVLPDITFWGLQSPKQLADDEGGRLANELDVTVHLLKRAQDTHGRSLLVIDEAGQGTSQQGTEEAMRRILGEAAAVGIFMIVPNHELDLSRAMLNASLTSGKRIVGSGKVISHELEDGVAETSGAHVIAEKIGYLPAQTRRRVISEKGDGALYDRWMEVLDKLPK